MRRLRLLLGAAVLGGVLSVASPSPAPAATPSSCAFTGDMTFSKPVRDDPAESRFKLRVECHGKADAPVRSSVAGYKWLTFNGTAAVDSCGGPAAGTGSVTGHPNESPIQGTFAFAKTPTEHYELTGSYTRGARRYLILVSGELTGNAACNYSAGKLVGTVRFQEAPDNAPLPGQMVANVAMSPGVSASTAGAAQIVSVSGVVSGVWGGAPSQCNAGFSGRSTMLDTAAQGRGVLSGSCHGRGLAQTCSMDYVRAGAVLSLVGECTGTQEGVFTATLLLAPTGAPSLTSFTAAGPASFG